MNDLSSFIESVCTDSRLRVDEDFGDGFVRLKQSEAERRQATQDIRSTEDIVIECLRNSRDAGAGKIFVALTRDESKRTVVIIDDGSGIPENMHDRIFEPRVTSKLDTAHMDKWGMHGRGMALYSIKMNAAKAYVACSRPEYGSSIVVETDLLKLGEKTDQSTFPSFEVRDGVHVMRGPRNLLRTCAEFALEHRRDCEVYCGSATIYEYGLSSVSPVSRALGKPDDDSGILQSLAFAVQPEDFVEQASLLGIDISTRSARRIMDGSIKSVRSMLERLQSDGFRTQHSASRPPAFNRGRSKGLKLDEKDVDLLRNEISRAFQDIADRYFLSRDVRPEIRVTGDSIRVSIPIEKQL